MSKNISDVSQAGGAAISALGATGLGLYLTAKNTTKENAMSNKGLTPPNKKLVKRVLNRSADRVMKSPKNVQVLGKIQDRLIRSTGIKDPFKVTGKAWDLNTKSMNKKFMKEALTKTMGNIKKLTPVGIVLGIMSPKKVGDATLKGNERQFKKDYGNT